MRFFDSLREFFESLRRLASQWKLLAALALLVAFGTLYIERKLSSPAPGQVKSAPEKPGEAAPAGEEKTQDKTEPRAGAEAPVPDIASQTVDVAARPVALLKGQGTWDDAPKTLADAIAKVTAAAAKAKLALNGRPIAVFTQTDDKGFHFEAMAPLAKAPEGKPQFGEGVEIGASPAGKALKFQHRGSYAEIEATYEAIAAYLDEKGLDSKDLIIEEYLTDLTPGDDPNLEVDIYVFVK